MIYGCALLGFSSAGFAADNDAQAWLTTGLRADLAPRLSVMADVSARLSNDRGGVGQGIARGTISYRLSDAVSIEGVYGRFVSYDDGRVTMRENRLAQHIVWRLGQALGGRWTARTRLEQRLVQGADETGLRLRQRIAYRRPLSETVDVQLATEAFVALNDTDFGARAGFDTLRSTAAVTLPLSQSIDLEVGYLNQWSQRRNAPDRLIHAGTATLTFSL
jgi:hypothetical protein